MRKDPGKQRVKGKGFLFSYSSETEMFIVLGKAKKQEYEAGLAVRNQRNGISSIHRKQTVGAGSWVRLQILKVCLQ